MAKNKRLSRLLEIILLVQSRPDWRPKKLAEHFGISETRIYQDIRELTAAGVPIAFSGAGYHIGSGFAFTPTKLTAEELFELLYPGHLFAGRTDLATAHTLLQAKLASCLPPELRNALGRVPEQTRILVGSATVQSPHFRRLHEAIAQRRRIAIRYASRTSGRTIEREIDPYALIYRRHSWYLIAKCHLRQDIRKFRVSRILTGAFTTLHFPEPTDFSLDEYLRGLWEIWGGTPTNVAIRFSRRVADLIRDHDPRPGQTIQEMPGGDIIYRINVRGIQEIAWWIMQYGPDAEALEPTELRQLLLHNAQKTSRLYTHTAPAARLHKVAETIAPYTARTT